MKILIDIGHPAHVHLFKNFAHEMINIGHKVLFTCRDKEFEIELLKQNSFVYISLGRKFKSSIGKIWGMFKFDFLVWKICREFKPDILISHGSIYAAHAAFLLRKPHIAFEDTFNFEQIRLYEPFTKVILTSDYDNPLKSNKKVIQYAGYHELAYLHPNRFAPDKSILKELGVEDNEKYVILRFVAWNASHDIGHNGISYTNKLKAISEFEKFGKVFISSEAALPVELERYRIKIAPWRMHDAMAFASLVFGESSTMAEESAMLGTPSIYLFNGNILYTQELEKKYGLMFNYSESCEDQEKAITTGIELLRKEKVEIEKEWEVKQNIMLKTKINVTSFFSWFIENYPESKKIMKENPNYQYRFK